MVNVLVTARCHHLKLKSMRDQTHYQFGQIVCVFESRLCVRFLMNTGPGQSIWERESIWECLLFVRKSFENKFIYKLNENHIVVSKTLLCVIFCFGFCHCQLLLLLLLMILWIRRIHIENDKILTSNARRISIHAFMHSNRKISFRIQSRYR